MPSTREPLGESPGLELPRRFPATDSEKDKAESDSDESVPDADAEDAEAPVQRYTSCKEGDKHEQWMANTLISSLHRRHAGGKSLRKRMAGLDKNDAGQAKAQYGKKADALRRRILTQATQYAAFTEQPCAVMLGNQDGVRVHDFSLEAQDGRVIDYVEFEDAIVAVTDILEQNRLPPAPAIPSVAAAAMQLNQQLSSSAQHSNSAPARLRMPRNASL